MREPDMMQRDAESTVAIAPSGARGTDRGDGGARERPTRDTAARLGLMIGERRLLVDLSEAGEIVPVPSTIVPVPLTREWLLGVTNLRGALFTVVDLRRFAGEGVTELTKESRLLSVSPALNFNATLVVSRMLGLRNTATMTESLAPDDGTASSPWFGRRYTDADGRVWEELLLSRLIATPEFLMVGR